MACIYQRARSPFFWVKYRNPGTGKTCYESTGIRVSDPDATQLTNRYKAQLKVKELGAPKVRNGERWDVWAHRYLSERYGGTGSLKNALLSLADLLVFFAEHQALAPRLLTYEIARQFVAWRKSARTLPAVKHNTARLRWVYLRVLMSEAVRRGFADVNVCREVPVKKGPSKVKLEISLEHQAQIEALLADAKPWMREQWLVLMRQGCRIAESLVPMDQIDEARGTITFRLKGGKLHTAPLHPDLQPLVAKARAEKRATLIVAPPAYASVWSWWFHKHGFACYSAHCTRVTVITRLLRADHSPAKVCAFIGHSEEINVIYRRLKPTDCHELLAALG